MTMSCGLVLGFAAEPDRDRGGPPVYCEEQVCWVGWRAERCPSSQPKPLCGTSATLVRQGTGDEPPTDTVGEEESSTRPSRAGRPERRWQLQKLVHLQLCWKSPAPSLRSKIRQQLETFLHPCTVGVGRAAGAVPVLFVIEHFRRCAQQKRCAATIFVDTKAAYYRLVRQLATGRPTY